MKTIKKLNKLVFNDFSTFNEDENVQDEKLLADVFYNIDIKDKIIKSGKGISALKVYQLRNSDNMVTLNTAPLKLEQVNELLFFKQYFSDSKTLEQRLLLHGSDKKLYIYQLYTGVTTFNWLYNLTFDSPPVCLTYKLEEKDTIILSSKEKMVVWTTNRNPYLVEDVPIITSMCISNNVLFCTVADEAYRIWFCLSSNPELLGKDQKFAKYFTLDDERGYARKILTFKENLYAIRDYGITRINYYSSDNISTTQVYLSDSMIFADTIAVSGDALMFMTRDGLYSFNGTSVRKVSLGIEKLFSEKNISPVASSLQDKYYLALRLDFNDGENILCENDDYTNNALIILNLPDNSFQLIRGVDIKSMLSFKSDRQEKMIFTFNSHHQTKLGELDDSSKNFDETLPKFYKSKEIYKDNLDKFIIRNIKILSNGEFELKIITESKQHTFNITKDGIKTFDCIIPCEHFHIEILFQDDNVQIKDIELNYYKA